MSVLIVMTGLVSIHGVQASKQHLIYFQHSARRSSDIFPSLVLVILQLLEAAWCLTNIAAGKPEETKALLPALPLLIAHLGG